MAPKNPKNLKKEDAKRLKKPIVPVPVGASVPTTSKDTPPDPNDRTTKRKKCLKYIYDKETKKFLNRTWRSWLYILAYSFFYFLFLMVYMLIFLFAVLMAYKNIDFAQPKLLLLTYSDKGVGLSATPTSEFSYPMIWYKMGNDNDYQKYISAIDRLFVSRRDANFDTSKLGPCSKPPYGYGDKPCVVIRINRQLKWAGRPLRKNSTTTAVIPKEVKEWMSSDDKLWLHCDGYHQYDKEHIGKINYFPYPPGFDPKLFPLDVRNQSPLVAIQLSEFEQGVSLAIQCKLWYESGPASVEFLLYVEPESLSKHFTRKTKDNKVTNSK